jgi:hypothetical protein
MFVNRPRALFLACIVLLSLCLMEPAAGQDAQGDESSKEKKRSFCRLSPSDLILPITSIEFGVPDRWSMTARYIHQFDPCPGHIPRRDNFCVTLSPGLSGGRLGLGYEAIFTWEDEHDLAVFFEARAVLLRTWGNPLVALPDENYIGVEVRGAYIFLCNIGVGWYKQISSFDGEADTFVGVHLGVGI